MSMEEKEIFLLLMILMGTASFFWPSGIQKDTDKLVYRGATKTENRWWVHTKNVRDEEQ